MGLDLVLYREKQYQQNEQTHSWSTGELAYGRKTWSLVYAFKQLTGVEDKDDEMIVPFEALQEFVSTYQPIFKQWEDWIASYTHLDYVLYYQDEGSIELNEQEQRSLESAYLTLETLLEQGLAFIDSAQLGLAWELRAWVQWIEAIQKEVNDPEHDTTYRLVVSY